MVRDPRGDVAPHPEEDGNPHDGRPDPTLQVIREFFRGRTDVRLALVFGSRAKGAARPTSDVDVAVHAPGVDPLGLAADLSRATGLEVDLVDLEDAGVPLLARIVGEAPSCTRRGGERARGGGRRRWRISRPTPRGSRECARRG